MHGGQNKASTAACITVLVLRASHQPDECWAGLTSQQVLLNKYPLRELTHGTSKGMPRPLKKHANQATSRHSQVHHAGSPEHPNHNSLLCHRNPCQPWA